ncbi:sugar ABC transporter substrate-binding protein [Labrys wisconsinensis]|uniref:ABC-type sugar transport system substrate-binding protein n=1 Tax=Labrys wisconsinensis TaxID=425677 RepID=A0ABU0J277_9HYPH|nr:sugar ABC transporter substrate-binding protein [Labrys wisconsinensis]MDQ0467327.1 ABC-type sugar transport system substrate-binding protein [Labrys wisconsinensis]
MASSSFGWGLRAAVAALGLATSGLAPASAADKGTIVVFVPSSTNPYIGQFQKGARDKAAGLGYTIKVIENNFNQAEQDSQVQQQLASGEAVAGYVWWPFENAAGLGSLRALSQSGAPVIVSNQYPIKGTEAYWTAYAGANDFLSGKTAAELLLDACAKAPIKCGKGAIIRFPAGVSAGDDRVTGFQDAVKGKLETIAVVPTAGFLEDEGYKVAAQIIPANKGVLTWLYTENDSIAGAATQAARENGLTPGKDILIVGGTCHGDSSHVVNGELVGTAIQSGYFEGWLAVQTLAKFVNTGKVEDGEVYVEAGPDAPPSDEGAPHKYNFLPNPPVGNSQQAYDQTKLWGRTAKELCNF